jgi:hypothetical protein
MIFCLYLHDINDSKVLEEYSASIFRVEMTTSVSEERKFSLDLE